MDEATEVALFLRRAGHDLHEPLVAIEGYLAFLAERAALDDDARELVEGARADAAQMRRRLGDTLAYARALTAEPTLARVDATECAREAAKRAGASAATIGALPFVRADAELLTSALEAVISNAKRSFQPPSPRSWVPISWPLIQRVALSSTAPKTIMVRFFST